MLVPNAKSNCSEGAASFTHSYQSSHRIWSECAARVLICPGFKHHLHNLFNQFNQFKIQVKVGSHDPIFSSNYSSANFLRQQLDVRTPIFDKFPFYVLDENTACSISIQLDQPIFNFPTLDFAKYFYKMAATAGPTVLDKIRWDTLPYGREKSASSPFPPFQCCSYVVKNFDIHVDLQH